MCFRIEAEERKQNREWEEDWGSRERSKSPSPVSPSPPLRSPPPSKPRSSGTTTKLIRCSMLIAVLPCMNVESEISLKPSCTSFLLLTLSVCVCCYLYLTCAIAEADIDEEEENEDREVSAAELFSKGNVSYQSLHVKVFLWQLLPTFFSNSASRHIRGCKPLHFILVGWVILEAGELKHVTSCLILFNLDPIARNWFYRYEGKLPTLRKVLCAFELRAVFVIQSLKFQKWV